MQYRLNIHIRNETQGTNTYSTDQNTNTNTMNLCNTRKIFLFPEMEQRLGGKIITGWKQCFRNIENNSEKIDLIVPFHLSFVTYFMSMSTSATIWNDMVKSTI